MYYGGNAMNEVLLKAGFILIVAFAFALLNSSITDRVANSLKKIFTSNRK